MLVRGDIKCLHCGFITGQWTGINGTPLTYAGSSLTEGDDNPRLPDTPLRCTRCDGPVYLEDVEPVVSSHRLRRIRRLRKQLAALDARRRDAA